MVDKQQLFKHMNLFSLKNKIVIVTGASGLLGREHVIAIADAGGTPVLLDLNEEVLNKQILDLNSKYKIEASAFSVDITNESQIDKSCKAIIAKYGKIDGLVNNAANNPKVENTTNINFSRLENFPLDVWHKDLDVALKGTFSFSIFNTASGFSFILTSHVPFSTQIFPGATTLTLILGASLWDKAFENDIRADFATL